MTQFRKRAFDFFKNIKALFFDFIFPIECLGCGKEEDWICPNCLNSIALEHTSFSCIICRKPCDITNICVSCRIDSKLDGVYAATSYQLPVIKKAIKMMKYQSMSDINQYLSVVLDSYVDRLVIDHLIPKSSLVIPVPLHKKRFNLRGFNQAELIADSIAQKRGWAMDNKSLYRKYNTEMQSKMTGDQRRKNLYNAFNCAYRLDGYSVILIDDVTTTGATLNECAKMLKLAGVDKVYGLVVAKG